MCACVPACRLLPICVCACACVAAYACVPVCVPFTALWCVRVPAYHLLPIYAVRHPRVYSLPTAARDVSIVDSIVVEDVNATSGCFTTDAVATFYARHVGPCLAGQQCGGAYTGVVIADGPSTVCASGSMACDDRTVATVAAACTAA